MTQNVLEHAHVQARTSRHGQTCRYSHAKLCYIKVPWLPANLRASDRNDCAWKTSAAGMSCIRRLQVAGIRARNPDFTVLTLPNGTWKRPVWRERLTGVASPNNDVRWAQSSRWLKIWCRKRRSDWMSLALMDGTRKWERRLSYSREGHRSRVLAASHMRNLCWSRSNRARWVTAAPLQMILPYSITDLTWALNAHSKAAWLKRTLRGQAGICILRMRRPSILLALATVASTCDANVSLASRRTPRSRIWSHLSRWRSSILYEWAMGEVRRVKEMDLHFAGLRQSRQVRDQSRRRSKSDWSVTQSALLPIRR